MVNGLSGNTNGNKVATEQQHFGLRPGTHLIKRSGKDPEKAGFK
jgi:hypothetical protein